MATGTTNIYQQLIMSILTTPAIRKIVSTIISSETLDSIEKWLQSLRGRFYIPVFDIEQNSTSKGVVIKDREISLFSDWGVKLVGSTHPFINKPTNIRSVQDRLYISNSSDSAAVPPIAAPASIVDSNMNFVISVGKIGTSLTTGQYTQSDDFLFSPTHNKYFIASSVDNIIQIYDSKANYLGSLGTGVAGIPALLSPILLSAPIAVAVGERGLYICCKDGKVTGSGTKKGYIVLLKPDLTFDSIPLFAGKNGGSGSVFEYEVDSPKDMILSSSSDKLIVLNGNDEIGIFNVATDYSLVKVLNIPSEIYSPNLGLSKITSNGDTIYITAATTGQIIALSMSSGKLIGILGKLKDETTHNSDQTLTTFNGISGICFNQDKLVTTEVINNRVQQFGASLVQTPYFLIDFSTVSLPASTELYDVVTGVGSDTKAIMKIIDRATQKEYSLQSALFRKVRTLSVRVYLDTDSFSSAKSSIVLSPVVLLCEETNG
jgi:hypothetical protein